MKSILEAFRRAPKRVAGVLALVGAIAIPAGLLAWGPDRPTYTLENPADHVVFNSITNNKKHGDERNFVQIKEVGGTYKEQVSLTPGKEYEVYAFYHNNAKSYLNSKEHNYKGIAVDAKMRMNFPKSVRKGEKARFDSVISASNAQPRDVWDEAYGLNTTDQDLHLQVIPGSAKITNLGKSNGSTMPNTLFTTGAPLGYDALDGKVPGCNEFSGYVTYRFKVAEPQKPNFTVEKQVAPAGSKQFSKQITAKPGETVEYKIQYKNTGNIQQNNVALKDILPQGVQYVAGSAYIASASTNGQWKQMTDALVSAGGTNIGSYTAGSNAYIKLRATINKDLACGEHSLINTAEIHTQYGMKKDTAKVIVKKECEQPAKYVCSALAINQIGTNRYEMEVGYNVEGGTFSGVTYRVIDAQGKTVATVKGAPNKAQVTLANAGAYKVETDVVFMINGQAKTVTSDSCKGTITIPAAPAPEEVKVCRLDDRKIVTITKKEYEANKDKYSTNLDDCKPVVVPVPEQVKVCRLDDKKIVTITKKEYEANKDKYSTNLDDCKPATPAPKQIQVCDLTTKTFPVTIKESDFDAKKHSKNAQDCATPPTEITKEMCPIPGKQHLTKSSPDCMETPRELPKTGGLDIAAFAGLGAMTISLGYYLASRRTN